MTADLSQATVEDLARELRRRTLPDEAMDAAFDLTPRVTDSRLRDLYQVIVVRMLREAEHLPVNTAQRLIVDRIATGFVMAKQFEARRLGDNQGFSNVSMLKDFNAHWLAMTTEFNKQIQLAKPSDREMVRRMVKDAVEVTFKEALRDALVPQDKAQELLRRLVGALDDRGV